MIDWLKHVPLELHCRRRNETHRTGMRINMVSYWMLHAPLSHLREEKKITNWPKCPDQRFDLILCRLSFIDTVVYSRFFAPSNDYSSLFIQRDVSAFKMGCDAIKTDPNKKRQRFNHTHAHAFQCAASFRQFITFIYFYLFFARRFFICFVFFIASTFHLFLV